MLHFIRESRIFSFSGSGSSTSTLCGHSLRLLLFFCVDAVLLLVNRDALLSDSSDSDVFGSSVADAFVDLDMPDPVVLLSFNSWLSSSCLRRRRLFFFLVTCKTSLLIAPP